MRLPVGLGWRAGLAGALALVVVGVGAVLRRDRGSPGVGGRDAGSVVTSGVHLTAGDDGEVERSPDDNIDEAALRSAALAFCAVWLRRDLTAARWLSGLAPMATEALVQSLGGADPLGVPASRLVGEPRIVLGTERYAQVAVPVDNGTIILELLKLDGSWLIDGVDWERV